jgi:hypothetical protein
VVTVTSEGGSSKPSNLNRVDWLQLDPAGQYMAFIVDFRKRPVLSSGVAAWRP